MPALTFPSALHDRQFRLLWLSQLVSIAGLQMQFAAILWHVNELSGQPIALGAVGLARLFPVLALSLFTGALADVVNRRRLMLVTQTVLALLAGLLGWLTLTGRDSVWAIYAISAASAAVGSFDLPAQQSLVPNLVPREHLTNAFSLTTIAAQFGAVVGPAIGGLVLAGPGIARVYEISAVSLAVVPVALILMGPVEQDSDRSVDAGVNTRAIWQGLRFIGRQPIILSSMLLDFFATFFSSATALLPIFAKDILDVGPVGYGWLVSAQAVGAGSMGLVLSFLGQVKRQGRVLLVAVGVFGLATVAFGLSRSFWLTFAALAVSGGADNVSTVIRNTVRQIQTPDFLRGRVISVSQIFFLGGPQLGELEAGLVAQILGAPFAVITGGLGCLLAGAWVARRWPQLRRYQGDEPIAA